MTSPGRLRAVLLAALLAYLAGATILLLSAAGRHPLVSWTEAIVSLAALTPSVLFGLLVAWRRPDSPVGPALVALAAAPCLTWQLEDWGASYGTGHPWPAAHVGAVIGAGIWVFNLAGFVWLCLVFPDGRLAGRRWAALPWAFLAAAVAIDVVVALDPARFVGLAAVAGVALLAVLGSAVASLVVRYRRGSELVRLQLRWLVLGAGSVPVLLAAGWVAESFGAPIGVSYLGFLAAMLLFMPATVAVAILRHDLLDVDRLLGESVSWLVTSLVSAGMFATVVVLAAQIGADSSRIGITAAAFVTALVLLPVHRWVHEAAGRVFDRERTVMTATMQQFVRRVRDGAAQPEEVESALRESLGDPALIVLLRVPGTDGYVDLSGRPTSVEHPDRLIPLSARESEVGALVLGRSTARRQRRARELAVEARLPIEVSRLRMELRRALDDARSSRARLVEAVTEERRRLERDLHDGAQQRILAVGMRLRSVQRGHPPGEATHRELDAAVLALEATVTELRRLAHGIRPSRLDEGLDVAIRDLVSDLPIPVEVRVGAVDVSEAVATTAYFVVAECLANTLKHAHATRVGITVEQELERLTVQVTDDGRGGASSGFGLTALRDRVTALGGLVDITSPAGAGTTIRAEV